MPKNFYNPNFNNLARGLCNCDVHNIEIVEKYIIPTHSEAEKLANLYARITQEVDSDFVRANHKDLYELAICIRFGLAEFEINNEKVFEIAKLLADKGYNKGQHLLAFCYENKIGVTLNQEGKRIDPKNNEILGLYEIAAASGYPPAVVRHAECLIFGDYLGRQSNHDEIRQGKTMLNNLLRSGYERGNLGSDLNNFLDSTGIRRRSENIEGRTLFNVGIDENVVRTSVQRLPQGQEIRESQEEAAADVAPAPDAAAAGYRVLNIGVTPKFNGARGNDYEDLPSTATAPADSEAAADSSETNSRNSSA